METNKFHALPPLKRFRLMHQHQQQEPEIGSSGSDSMVLSNLPAKKRMASRDFTQTTTTTTAKTATNTTAETTPLASSFVLPAKKRVWAFAPDDDDDDIDLNVDSTHSTTTAITTATTSTTVKTTPPISSYALPTKKRVWAFAPDDDIDLNVEYKPSMLVEKPENPTKEDQNLFKIEAAATTTTTTTQVPLLIETEEKTALTNEQDLEEIDGDSKADQSIEDDGEDGIMCAVCQSSDGDPIDPIVFCDGCELMVHSTCYGNPLTNGIPEGDWFCNQCLSKPKNPKTPISCCLCPSTVGAMKPTNDGRWAHVVCALLVPEVFFQDPIGRDGIDCSKVAPRRWDGKCYVCGCGNIGCVVDCSEAKCSLAFHVTCGLKEELAFEYNEGRKKGAVVAGFCKDHTKLWKKQQLTGKFKIVPRD